MPSNSDYDVLVNISPELAIVVAMATEQEREDLINNGYKLTDSIIALQWSILNRDAAYKGIWRALAATCLTLLMECESE